MRSIIKETSRTGKGPTVAVLHPIGGKWVKTEREACPSLEMVRTHHPTRRTSDVNPEYHGVSLSPRRVERASRKGGDHRAIRLTRIASPASRGASRWQH